MFSKWGGGGGGVENLVDGRASQSVAAKTSARPAVSARRKGNRRVIPFDEQNLAGGGIRLGYGG